MGRGGGGEESGGGSQIPNQRVEKVERSLNWKSSAPLHDLAMDYKLCNRVIIDVLSIAGSQLTIWDWSEAIPRLQSHTSKHIITSKVSRLCTRRGSGQEVNMIQSYPVRDGRHLGESQRCVDRGTIRTC